MEAEAQSAPLFILTPRALAQLRHVLEGRGGPQAYCLEVSAKPAGCKEMEYELGLTEAPGADQLCWQQEGIRICIALSSIRYVVGARLDFVESEAETGFVFSNPHLPPPCACEPTHADTCAGQPGSTGATPEKEGA